MAQRAARDVTNQPDMPSLSLLKLSTAGSALLQGEQGCKRRVPVFAVCSRTVALGWIGGCREIEIWRRTAVRAKEGKGKPVAVVLCLANKPSPPTPTNTTLPLFSNLSVSRFWLHPASPRCAYSIPRIPFPALIPISIRDCAAQHKRRKRTGDEGFHSQPEKLDVRLNILALVERSRNDPTTTAQGCTSTSPFALTTATFLQLLHYTHDRIEIPSHHHHALCPVTICPRRCRRGPRRYTSCNRQEDTGPRGSELPRG
jgi:hypothetical protein